MKLWLLVCLASSIAFSKENIALVSVEALHGITGGEAKMIFQRFESELNKRPDFQVIERIQVDQLLKEQGFQAATCDGPTCQAEMGKMIGLKKVLSGTVGKIGSIHSISVKVIDVKTGELLQTINEDINGTIEEIFLTGCKKLAAQVISASQAKTNAQVMRLNQEKQELQTQEALLAKTQNSAESSESSWGTVAWIAGGVALLTTGVIALMDPPSETKQQTLEVQP